MEDCMTMYREGILSRAILYYKKGQYDERRIKFSDFKDGTADLSGCGSEDERQVYTGSKSRFLMVEGLNEGKLVTFIGPRYLIQDLLPDGACNMPQVVVLWRLGDWEDLSWFEYSTLSTDDLSANNLYENWRKSVVPWFPALAPFWGGEWSECGCVFTFVC